MKYAVQIRLLCLSLLFVAGCVQQGTITGAALISQTATPSAAPTTVAQEERSERASAEDMHLTTSNTIRDVVNHPAFAGFGHFILSLDRGRYDNDMPLERVASLLPYHSNVDPDAAVNTINYLIDEVASGETIFYDYYTDQQK